MATDELQMLAQALEGGFDPEQAKLRLLQQQLEQAEALAGTPIQRRSSGIGGALGAVGDFARGVGGHVQAGRLREEIGGILDQQRERHGQFQQLMLQRAQQRAADEQRARAKADQQALAAEMQGVLDNDPQWAGTKPFADLIRKRGGDPTGLSVNQMRPLAAELGKDYGNDLQATTAANRLAFDERKAAADLALENLKLGKASDKELLDLEKDFAGRLANSPAYKDFLQVSAAHKKMKRVLAAGGSANPADDVAMIYGLMKIIDPGASVQEGDKANAENTTGAFGRLWNHYNKLVDGKGLGKAQYQEFMSAADRQYAGQLENYRMVADPIVRRAKELGVDPRNVDLIGSGAGDQGSDVEILNGERWRRGPDGVFAKETP